jgi:flagellar biosynthesis protein
MANEPNNPSLDIEENSARPAPVPPDIRKAVAIEYARGVDAAPRVTASGHGSIAEQILVIAFDRGIKVREDAELVDILSLIEVDSPIPLEAFSAVAEILAYVYRANDALKPRGASQ